MMSRIKERFASCTEVAIQGNIMCKLLISPTVNRTGVIRNTTEYKRNSLTIFFPSTFYLIRRCCYSKQKSIRKLQGRHRAKTSLCTAAVCDPTDTLKFRWLHKSNRRCLLSSCLELTWLCVSQSLIIQLHKQTSIFSVFTWAIKT
jgi:hypothetical protein